MMTLTDYLTDTKLLLRDRNSLFFSETELKRYINEARYQIALQTGCIRILVPGQSPFGSSAQPGGVIPGAVIPGMLPGANPDGENASGASSTVSNQFMTIAGTEMYPYGFANPFLRRANQGVKGIIDVIDVAISWGGIRPAMTWMPWEDLQAYARSYNQQVTSFPFVFSTYGDGERGQVWLFPVPTQAMEMEWDCTCVPSAIYSNNDFEALPDPFQHYVKFYAAYLALVSAQRYGAAQIHWQYLYDHLGIGRTASDRGKTSNPYWKWSIP